MEQGWAARVSAWKPARVPQYPLRALCNGSTSGIRPQAIPFTVTAAQSEVINQILALQAAQDR